MKVLHLATGRSGGARLAAVRLSQLQSEMGTKAVLLPPAEKFASKLPVTTLKGLGSKIVTLSQSLLTVPKYGLFSTISISNYDQYGIDFTNFDVVHIHNWYNLLSIKDFEFISSRSKLVFTLHDERLLTGGCHYSFECKGYLDSCNTCPGVRMGQKFVQRRKLEIDEVFSQLGNYGLISPTDWLLKKSEESPLFKNAKITAVIPNVTNFHVDGDKPQENLKIPNSIIFVAADINQKIKGLELLIESLNIVSRHFPNIHLHIVGGGQANFKLNFRHTFHGYLPKDELNRLMQETSLCVIPSILDNLPSVAIEAIKNLNILIVNDTGGLSELVKHGVTGFKSQVNSKDLAEKIMHALKLSKSEDKEIRKNALNSIMRNYGDDTVFHRHNQIYESVINLC
jgi:glycosyltransferase involved in cell wall biosynthesis